MNRIDNNDCFNRIGSEDLDFSKSLSDIKKNVEKLIELFSGNDVPRRESPFENGPSQIKKFDPEQEGPSPNLSRLPETRAGDANTTPDLSGRGSINVVNKSIIVDGGVFDGKGATFTASSALGDGGQSESQQPIFILKNGATLKNVDLGENGADGIHVYNGATLQNVNWQDVGEDALTVKSPGDVFIEGGSARGASDKVFQLNADTKFHVSNFTADGFQTLIRTNGGKEIDADVSIDGGSFANGTVLFRTDSSIANVQLSSNISSVNVKNSVRNGDDVTPL